MAEYVPAFVENEEPREVILKLGAMITNRIPIKLGLKKLTKYDPEYWGLSMILTDDMAEVALKMEVRKPKTFEQIKALTGMDDEKLQKILDEMSYIGIIEYHWENLDGKNPNHEKRYVVPMFVPGSAEFMNMNPDILAKYPDFGRFFEQMSRLPLEKVTPMVPPGGAGIGMHVIPVEKAISAINNTIPLEHISHWLDKYEGKYACSPCSCRRSRRTFDEGCADDPEGWCIAVGDMADYVVETNKSGWYITKEEVLRIFQQAEDNGFVHQITNIDGENKIFGICNCNVNVCYALRTSQLFNTPNLSRSAYVARVNKDDCVACGKCVENCPAGAVKLGQKLCTKDGGEIEYPRHVLPGEVKWGRHMWEPDYRNVNRKNCYDTGTAPCKTACPAHIAIQGYLKMAAQGRYTEALALIKKDNPLPAICGRICNHRCEDACTRGTIDQAIAIDAVKDFIAQQDLKAETRYIPKKVVPTLKGAWDEKIAIIGSGPAGLSCAYFLAEKGYSPTIFEKNEKPGGMLRYGVPSFNLEKDIVDAEIDVIKAMGVEIKCGVEVGKDVTIQQLREQGYKGFYIAIGLQEGRKANIPGEDSEGVMSAVRFLRQVAGDESYKVPGRAIVIGGGNVAVDTARSAYRCGTDSVEVYCLEKEEEMPATADELGEIRREGIAINNGWGPKEILSENGKVKGVVFKRCLSVYDEKGGFAPKYDENDTITVECEHVYMAIGQSVVWGELLKGTKVELGAGGYPVADPLTNQTAEPDIFVGGDVYYGPKYSIDAIACGREGAISLHRFVQPNSSLTIGRNRRDFIELDKNNIRVENYDNTPRQVAARNKDIDSKTSFRDGRYSFTEEQVKAETARCLGCGASVVDPNKCLGCGVCTTKCEFDAIKLYRERPECSKMIASEEKLKYVLLNGAKQAIKRKLAGK
ncbi:MAG: FAD-dependent oxidoreductase [Oscillospiraceae bacterium]|nr:FAD-dependent oxidoreductase [Oscillospiraceae bacterium]